MIIERPGFLQEVVTEMAVNDGTEIDLGHRILIEGDTDRSGIVDVVDLVRTVDLGDYAVGDPEYDEACDFGQKGFIGVTDLVSTVTNGDCYMNIEKYKEEEI